MNKGSWLQRKAAEMFGREIILPDGKKAICNVVAILYNTITRERRFILGSNIVTNAGDRYYATKMAGESAYFTVAGMRLGYNAGTASSPQKTDVKMQTTTGSTPVTGGGKAIDSTYPKTNDDDTDNTGRAVDTVTWRVSYATTEGNSANIATIDLPDSLTDGSITKSLTVANFSAKFEKTSSDTLKVFVNHDPTGV
jgi:hypothetical protein